MSVFGQKQNRMDRTQPAVRRSFRLRIGMSTVGPKRTSLVAMHMSAFDPKRTCVADACSLRSKLYGSACLTPGNGMINPKDYDRTNNCNYHAIDIETCYSCRTKKTEYNSPHDRADNAKRDVEQQALALLVDNLAPDKSCNEAEYDPTDDGHESPPAFAIYSSELAAPYVLFAMIGVPDYRKFIIARATGHSV
jgi:hypothetical protein